MRGKNFYFLPLFFCESENRWKYFLRIFLILEVGNTFITRTQKCFSLREPPVFRTFRKWSSITVCSLQHTTEYEYAMFCTHTPPPAEYVLFLLIIIIHSENLKINQFTLNTVVHILYSTLTLHCRFFSSSNLPELDFETSCTLPDFETSCMLNDSDFAMSCSLPDSDFVMSCTLPESDFVMSCTLPEYFEISCTLPESDFVMACTLPESDFVMSCILPESDFVMSCTLPESDFVMSCTLPS